MTGYIDKAMDELPKDVTTYMISPELWHMFKIKKMESALERRRKLC